jgi:hypothetical protein
MPAVVKLAPVAFGRGGHPGDDNDFLFQSGV